MKDNNMDVKEIIIIGLFMALTTIMTMFIQIPSPATKGYVNLGDMMVFTTSILMGRKIGFLVGGVGSAMADLLLGYNHYIPITFIVKGIEGYLVGLLYEKNLFGKNPLFINIIGGFWMTIGYFLFQIFLYGYKASLLSIPGNLVQGFIGAISSYMLLRALSKIDYFRENFNIK